MQDGWTLLTLASYKGNHKTVEVLLKHGADINAKTCVSRSGECEGAPIRGGLGGHGLVVRIWGQGSFFFGLMRISEGGLKAMLVIR